MHEVLSDSSFADYYTNGFVETSITLPPMLVDEIRAHYREIPMGRNDFPKFFKHNEHLAYFEGWLPGTLLNAYQPLARKLIAKFYARAYQKAVYCEQFAIEKVLGYLMDNGFGDLFRTRYIIASYDMYISNSHEAPPAGIHSDLPNLHHVYETENDLSLYIPLVDLDEENGGRLSVLPERRLKVPGNMLLRMLHEHFSQDPACLDEHGRVDPDSIDATALAKFARSKAYQDVLRMYKKVDNLAKTVYQEDQVKTDESAGRVLMFNNKNFHAAEQWHNKKYLREIYAIRMYPLYDAGIQLKRKLHDTPINNTLIDTKTNSVQHFEQRIDLSSLDPADMLRA